MNLAIVSNPRKRRKHSKRRRKARRASPRRRQRRAHAAAPRRRRRSHRVLRLRRNPSRRRRSGGGLFRQSGHSMTGLLIPAALGGAGALGFDFLYGKVSGYLPTSLQSNYYVAAGLKLLAAVGVATYGRKFMKPDRKSVV